MYFGSNIYIYFYNIGDLYYLQVLVEYGAVIPDLEVVLCNSVQISTFFL